MWIILFAMIYVGICVTCAFNTCGFYKSFSKIGFHLKKIFLKIVRLFWSEAGMKGLRGEYKVRGDCPFTYPVLQEVIENLYRRLSRLSL